ncbi:hypothetical protein CYCD_28720 [Tenuifilaceae bacterium CYCD]|nr:hypothetical protein CYCD_28720 [Tenuifilaceae bacterium CYCD]
MEPEYFLLIGVLVLVAVIVFFRCYLSRKAVVRRKLKNAIDKHISGFMNGDIAKIVGMVDIVGKPLYAPLSGRKCAYYYVLVEQRVSNGKSTYWKTIIEEERAGEFLLKDGRYCAHINTQKVKSYLVQDRIYTSGFMEDATEVLEKYLCAHGHKSENFIGLNKSLRYKEGVLEQGEVVAAMGRGEWKDAAQFNLSITLDRVLVIAATDDEPVYLSDDPATVRSIYS